MSLLQGKGVTARGAGALSPAACAMLVCPGGAGAPMGL